MWPRSGWAGAADSAAGSAYERVQLAWRCHRTARHATGADPLWRIVRSSMNLPATIRPATLADAEALGDAHVRVWRWAYRGLMPDEVLERMRPERKGAGWRQDLSDGWIDAWVSEAGGATTAVLWVLSGNERAQTFYARLGWAPDGATGTFELPGGGLPQLRLRKRLDGRVP